MARQGIGRLNVLDLQIQIRRLPKPVVAMVAGYAIGGGHILHLVCDLTIAADNARFGQTGPKVGSFDGGYGASLLARTIGLKRAKEVWFLCRQYDADTALEWGLVNEVVPLADLEAETVAWCRQMLSLSPMALRMLKGGLHAADDGLAGLQQFAGDATMLFYMSEEGQEGRNAFQEHRRARLQPLPPSPVTGPGAGDGGGRRDRRQHLAGRTGRARTGQAVGARGPAPHAAGRHGAGVVGTAAAHSLNHHVRWPGSAVLTAPSVPPVGVWWRALGALVVALAIQVGTNYANDYSDGIRGTDDARVGPVRLVASGLASPAAVRRAALSCLRAGRTWSGSVWPGPRRGGSCVVGAACLAAGWFYTGGPRPYGYAGLGELFVFVFFGLVATVGTFYVQTLRIGRAGGLVRRRVGGAAGHGAAAGQQPAGHRRPTPRPANARWPSGWGDADAGWLLRGLCRPALRRRAGLGAHCRSPPCCRRPDGGRAPSAVGPAAGRRPGEDRHRRRVRAGPCSPCWRPPVGCSWCSACCWRSSLWLWIR